MRFRNPFLLFVLLSFAFSCKKENMCDCLKGTGDITTKEVTVQPFTSIEVQSNINVFITQDTVYKVAVEAGKHLISSIEVEVKDQVLRLKNNNRCNFVRSYKKPVNVYVSLITLKELTHKGSGMVSSTNTIQGNEITANIWSSGNIDLSLNVNTGHFNLHVNSGDMNLRGFAGVSEVYSAGNGFVNASDLSTGYTFLNSKSTGNCYVNVTKEFYPSINWTGDVYYSGNPPLLTAKLNGKGQLIAQ